MRASTLFHHSLTVVIVRGISLSWEVYLIREQYISLIDMPQTTDTRPQPHQGYSADVRALTITTVKTLSLVSAISLMSALSSGTCYLCSERHIYMQATTLSFRARARYVDWSLDAMSRCPSQFDSGDSERFISLWEVYLFRERYISSDIPATHQW